MTWGTGVIYVRDFLFRWWYRNIGPMKDTDVIQGIDGLGSSGNVCNAWNLPPHASIV